MIQFDSINNRNLINRYKWGKVIYLTILLLATVIVMMTDKNTYNSDLGNICYIFAILQFIYIIVFIGKGRCQSVDRQSTLWRLSYAIISLTLVIFLAMMADAWRSEKTTTTSPMYYLVGYIAISGLAITGLFLTFVFIIFIWFCLKKICCSCSRCSRPNPEYQEIGIILHPNIEENIRRQNIIRYIANDMTGIEVYINLIRMPNLYGDTTCIICQEDFQDTDVIKILQCRHYYHQQCVGEWLKANTTCPNCRSEIV